MYEAGDQLLSLLLDLGIFEAGLDPNFAIHWLENGGGLDDFSHQTANSSVTTTEIYGEKLDPRASEEYERYDPDIAL